MKRLTYILTLALGTFAASCSETRQDEEVMKLVYTQPVPIAFDTYVLQSAETRAPQITALPAQGATGSIENVERLREVGFGVFATYSNGTQWTSSSSHVPNYMYDQKVTFDSSNDKWVYSPVKYWPNETTRDQHGATSDHTDYVSFFAYAPYVDYSADATIDTDNQITPADRSQTHWGVVKMSDNFTDEADGPYVYYAPASVTTNSVDLLWGVAPTGGYTYQPINAPSTLTVAEGMPFMNMIKPTVDTKLSFLFKHALARLGVTAKVDVDLWEDAQIYTDALKTATQGSTVVSIDEIRITGNFPSSAKLQLKNTTAGVPLWGDPTYDNADHTHTYVLDEQSIAKSLHTPEYVYNNHNVNDGLHDDFSNQLTNGLLKTYAPQQVLTTAKSDLGNNVQSADEEQTYLMVIPNPNDNNGTHLQVSITYSITSLDDHLMPSKNGYFRMTQTVNGDVTIPKMEAGKAYTLQCSIGLNTVLLEVNAYEWSEPITFGMPNVEPWINAGEEKKEFDNE